MSSPVDRGTGRPLEVALLLIAMLAFAIAGVLAVPIARGEIPFSAAGFYGLLLFVVAVQIIGLGNTPFGRVRRSPATLGLGLAVAAVGGLACFVPQALGPLPRALLILVAGPGALVQLGHHLVAPDRFRAWARRGGVFQHVIAACSAVYLCAMGVAVLLWRQQLLAAPWGAATLLAYAAALGYLAAVLHTIGRRYPVPQAPPGPAELSAEQSILLLLGAFLLLLGVVLVPVGLGLLAFSAGGQLGLLLVIFAAQMMAVGTTPLGPRRLSRHTVAAGLALAGLGVVSCIVPELLVGPLTVLVAAMSIASGATAVSTVRAAHRRQPHVAPELRRIGLVQLAIGVLSMVFGVSMLLSGLVPVLLLAAVLGAFGVLVLYLLRCLRRLRP